MQHPRSRGFVSSESTWNSRQGNPEGGENNVITNTKEYIYYCCNNIFMSKYYTGFMTLLTIKSYSLNLQFFNCPFKEGLVKLTNDDSIKVIVMGTRRSDPHGEHLERLSPSSPGWPNFLRLNPCLDWKYNDIWDFLRLFNVPYCTLYDQGYTSVGGKSNTVRNEELKIDENSYKPAYMLVNEKAERDGSRK